MSPNSAWPIRGVHSAWACQAARSSVHEMGPHSSELAVLFALSGTSVWRPQSHYTMSRTECRIKFPQNQRCRAKIALHPPQIKVSHLSPDPPVALSSHSQQAGGAAGWWRVSRHFWVPKTDRATGGYRSYSHTSRATLCN